MSSSLQTVNLQGIIPKAFPMSRNTAEIPNAISWWLSFEHNGNTLRSAKRSKFTHHASRSMLCMECSNYYATYQDRFSWMGGIMLNLNRHRRLCQKWKYENAGGVYKPNPFLYNPFVTFFFLLICRYNTCLQQRIKRERQSLLLPRKE